MNASTTPSTPPKDSPAAAPPPTNFIRQIIEEDLKNGKNGERVATRFPPEPNGYLHIGHAKSICLNFGLARDYKGLCNLRFDDTNPVKEDIEYVNSIQADVEWLGFKWSELLFASDYYEKIYDCAVALIKMGKAYVCDLTADDTREYRGTLTEPGKNSPYRNRSVEENLDLFERMRKGEFADGSRTLRAKIDMNSPNINMRDPVLYRIKKAHHHRTGDKWCIYPMYDYAHPLSDWIEGITHSLCTLEFEDHRPFYDWVLDTLKDTIKAPARPRQYEFAKLKLDYVVLSKRNLLTLVKDKHVNGWDDPRMPTIQGMRRRGFTPDGLRSFCEKVGVTKKDSCIEFGFLEGAIREDLDRNAPRVMGVLKPVKLVIENYPDEQMEEFDVANHPQRPELGTRKVPFSKVLYIELDDFMENPPNKFFRLGPGKEVRLRSAYFVKCTGYHKDDLGRITEIRATYDPTTRGGNAPDGRKVKGTIHWVSAAHALDAEVRIYDRLFNAQFPGTGGVDFLTQMNPHSLETVQAKVERSLTDAKPESRFQFERLGYFCVDRWDSKPEKLVLNRTVTLKDSWAKEKEL